MTSISDPEAAHAIATASRLQRILAPEAACTQPARHAALEQLATLHVVVGSLAIGGAERIVLDWAARRRSPNRVRLCVLHEHEQEWPVPAGLDVARLRGKHLAQGLTAFAREASQEAQRLGIGRPRVLCHMTRKEHRDALARAGATPVAVLHNAAEGWREPFEALEGLRVVAVSQACVQDLNGLGRHSDISLIRHLPTGRAPSAEERATLRARLCKTLGLPNATGTRLVAMVGGVKPQKNYPAAVRLLEALARDTDAYLVIFGGAIGSDGPASWQALRETVLQLGLQDRVRLPGFVPHAARYLAAFDACLNTSHYEGLSIATMEALVAQVPVVASKVGGQGEVSAPGLTLVPPQAPPQAWEVALRRAWSERPQLPTWVGFPAHRLWTLENLVTDQPLAGRVLFLTANLNAGGAQRSLVNLVTRLQDCLPLEVLVTGRSSSAHFLQELNAAKVPVSRTGDSRDCFDHAEAILAVIARTACKGVCFWNLDPKIKLLLAKVLPESVRLVDVSPGGYAFEELAATAGFQQLIGFSQAQLYQRLHRLVLKFDGEVPPEVSCHVDIVRNGVPLVEPLRTDPAATQTPRVVVNGRIAPSKFLIEIAQAMGSVWRHHPRVQLHILGSAEPRHKAYAAQVLHALAVAEQDNPGCAGAVLHGPVSELGIVARHDDISVVLGEHQGCPNAVLEAMALGMAVVANDSGGTREMVHHRKTGILLKGTSPSEVAQAIEHLLIQPPARQRMAKAAQALVREQFSMPAMTRSYLALFQQLFAPQPADTTC